MATVRDSLLDLVSEHLGVEKHEVRDTISFSELGADSLDVSEIIYEAEEEFDIHLPDEEITTGSSFGDLVEKVLGRMR